MQFHFEFDDPMRFKDFEQVDDYALIEILDELWEKLKDKAKIAYGIETFQWEMREFAIYDNNGYLLQFGQHMPPSSLPVSR